MKEKTSHKKVQNLIDQWGWEPVSKVTFDDQVVVKGSTFRRFLGFAFLEWEADEPVPGPELIGETHYGTVNRYLAGRTEGSEGGPEGQDNAGTKSVPGSRSDPVKRTKKETGSGSTGTPAPKRTSKPKSKRAASTDSDSA